MLKKFAFIGAAVLIAPRHINAIKDTGNILVVALDKSGLILWEGSIVNATMIAAPSSKKRWKARS